MLVMWLGDQITARGIGNGISLIIMINISSRLPVAIIEAYDRYFAPHAMHSLFELALLLVVGFMVMAGTVMLTQGVRKVPIHTARRTVGAKTYGGQASYMPLRVNFSGVMPIIFTQPLLQYPGALLSRINIEKQPGLGWLQWFGAQLIDSTSAIYLVSFTLLVFFFCFFWVATQFNAMRIADDLKRTGSYVPGIRPGRATAEYLDHTMTRVTLIGAIGLIFIAIFPQLLRGFLNIPDSIAGFFGGTSLLIIVGLSLFIPSVTASLSSTEYFQPGATASVFDVSNSLGYILIGLLAFGLGVALTILCYRIQVRNKKEQGGNHGRAD